MVAWLKMNELAAYLKTPKSTLYKLVARKRLRGHKVGRCYLFDRDEIDKTVKNGRLSLKGFTK